MKSVVAAKRWRHNVVVGAQNTSTWTMWGLFTLLVAIIGAITAAVCVLATPNFSGIIAYRIDRPDSAPIMTVLPPAGAQPAMLYLPHAGGAPLISLNGGAATMPTSHIDARLTRNLQLLTMTVPARARPTQIAIEQSPATATAALGPVFAGPQAALRPVLADQLWWGRVMQSAIPAAAWFAIAMSLLLIFFSRKPSKYMLLIAAFTLQLIIELELSPAWLGFQLNDYDRVLGVFTQLLIWQAVASWTGAQRQGRAIILLSSVLVILATATLKVIDPAAFPALVTGATILHVTWLVLVQVMNWRMVLSADIASPIFRAGTLACFLLAITGVLAYRFLALGGYATGTTFFLSNWVNVASSLAVFAFVVGALVNEVQVYRAQRRRISDLARVAAGHHVALSEQQQALRDEIQRNAVLEERQRFMRELHDGIGNQLLGLMIKMRSGGADAAALTDDVQSAIAELRLVTTALDDADSNLTQVLHGLRQRLDAQAASAGVALTWDVRLDPQLDVPPKLVLDVLRIVQECISNALKHAGASAIHVAISGEDRLVVSVADDGCGFDPAAVQAGLGLRNLRTRAAAWGGTADFARGEGGGTRVRVTLQIPT